MFPSTEPFTRFIYNKKYILNNNEVAVGVFKPKPKDRKTSLWHIAGLTESEITKDGSERMASRQRPFGRADLVAGIIYEEGLDIESDMPRSRHANISRWPAKDEAILDLALHLALRSTLHLVS